MNDPRFEIYPEHVRDSDPTGPDTLTGEYCWRFRAANGQIVAVGGESFTRREDASRSIHTLLGDIEAAGEPHPAIIDVTEVE